jgi:hypothetical protein
MQVEGQQKHRIRRRPMPALALASRLRGIQVVKE